MGCKTTESQDNISTPGDKPGVLDEELSIIEKGDSFAADEQYYQAFVTYLTASNIEENSLIISRIEGVLPYLNMGSGQEDKVSVRLGEQLSQGLKFYVEQKTSSENQKLAAIPIKLNYSTQLQNGKKTDKHLVLISSGQGYVLFTPPEERSVGLYNVKAFLYPPELEKLIEQNKSLYDSVLSLLEQKKSSVQINVYSMAQNITTSTLILDLDSGGKPVGQNITELGLDSHLKKSGYQLKVNNLDHLYVLEEDNNAVLDRIKRDYGDTIKRIIIGTAQLEDFSYDGQNYSVKVYGDIRVFNVQTGEVLLRTRRYKLMQGQNLDSTLNSSYRQLGIDLAQKLKEELP